MASDVVTAGRKVLTHSGSNTMWLATVWIVPQKDVAILVATNQADAAAQSACHEAVEALLRNTGLLSAK